MDFGVAPEALTYMLGRILMGRIGEPAEVAEMLTLCHPRLVHLQLT